MKRSVSMLLLLLAACGSAPAVIAGDGGGAGDAAMTGSDAGGDAASLPADGAPPDGGFDPANAPSTLGNFTTPSSAGCGLAGAATGVQTVSLTVGGATRGGVVVVPASYDSHKAYPVVFVFHGDGGTGSSIRAGLNLETAAAGKAIFAYPNGANQTWDATLGGVNQDMDFVMALRASLRSQYCIDLQRTYATGHSRGGFFTNQLACQYGVAEFAAVAPQSGTIDPGNNNAYVYGPPNPNGGPYMEGGNYDFMCPVDGTPSASPPLPKLPPPVMVFHGQCDLTGGVEFAQGRRTAEHWGFAARCTSTPAVVTAANQACATTCPTTSVDPCYVAPGCAAGHEVVFCAIPGMGHAVWCEAPARIWAFFAAH